MFGLGVKPLPKVAMQVGLNVAGIYADTVLQQNVPSEVTSWVIRGALAVFGIYTPLAMALGRHMGLQDS